MSQSRIKAKIMLIAMLSIALFCLLFIGAIIEIDQHNKYAKQISAQEQKIEELKNLKDYYNSNNYDENGNRDSGNYADGDMIFKED